jgi:hypothetical protein
LEDFAIRFDLDEAKNAEIERQLREQTGMFPDEVFATFTRSKKKYAVRFVKIERSEDTSPTSSLDVYKLDEKQGGTEIVKHSSQEHEKVRNC